MLLHLLGLFSLVFAVPIILALIRIYRSRINLKFYEQQGLPAFFNPFKGIFSLYDRKLPGNDKYSNMEYMKQISKMNAHLPGISVNKIDDNMSAVYLHDPEYIKEFLLQEDNFDKGSMEKGWPDHAGFWVYNGDKAARAKAVFSELFNYDVLATFTPKLCEMIIDSIRDFSKQKQLDTKSFKVIDLNDLSAIIFERVLNLLIFGQVDMEETYPI